nr:MAG TPA: hypothetical protein [Caudoviricetes sp.]
MKRWQRGKSRSAARGSPSLPLPEWEAGSIPAGGFPCESRACNLPLTEKGSGSPWPLLFLCFKARIYPALFISEKEVTCRLRSCRLSL